MKNKLAILAAALVSTALAIAFVAGCKQQNNSAKPDNVDYYTCTMHPSVHLHDPDANCPICSMSLVPVMKKKSQSSEPAMGEKGHDHAKMLAEQAAGTGKTDASTEEAPAEFNVPVSRQQQIEIGRASCRERVSVLV